MTTIRAILQRDLDRKIEEIIKLDQLDEKAVFDEMNEYVVTEPIRREYRALLRAIAEAPEDPDEGVGVWISGFFGSGKSSFAKNLGYLLQNETICGEPAATVMKRRLNDPVCSSLIDSIVTRLKTKVVMFDVQTDKAIGGSGGASISRYMYRALLRELGYAEDFDIADLEQSLEKDGKLEEFVSRFEKRYRGPWSKRRKMAQKMNEASAILHEMDPSTYNSADSWALSQTAKKIEVTPGFLVEKTFELGRRRAPDHAIVYILDEVGAHVARSVERIEDLRSVVEHFGTKGKNLRLAREIPAPTWVVITSQEKLDEVVDAIEGRRIDLNKLRDRFKHKIDLAPADIREIAATRVLEKNEEGDALLREIYAKNEGRIGQHLALGSHSRRSSIDEDGFVSFYPYPPHLLDLSIDIMSGIRLQPGATRHLGGSNRTIIKQAYEMLVSERTSLADEEVGVLVTIDRIFDLVENNLPSERRKDLFDIEKSEGFGPWEVKVAKAIALLQLVRDLPRTEENLAALLHARVDAQPCIVEIRAALAKLRDAQFIRNSEEGYKLQTASEKSWVTERRGIDVKLREREEVVRDLLKELLDDPKVSRYSFEQLKQLKVGVRADGHDLTSGDFGLALWIAEGPAKLEELLSDVQVRSRQKEHETSIHWVFALSPEIDDVAAAFVRSRKMVRKYDLLRSQSSLPPEFAGSLGEERQDEERLKGALRDKLARALETGTGYFQGEPREAAQLGRGRVEIFRALFDAFAGRLYPHLRMGARPVRGNEAEELLKAANLAGLPQVFYAGDSGLGLVVKGEGGKHVPDPNAPIAKELLDYLKRESSIGEKVSGKDLERRFGGLGYGWDREVVQLVLAVLLRAGAIEVTYQNRRFRDHQDPQCREPFSKVPAFRGSTFAPRESVGLKLLGLASQHLEEIVGREIDVEEAAIADAFKTFARAELAKTMPVSARAAAHDLPVRVVLAEYEGRLRLALESASDDCVRMLANEGKSLQESQRQIEAVREALHDDAIAEVSAARQVAARVWPELEGRMPELSEAAAELREALADERLHQRVPRLAELVAQIDGAFTKKYEAAHVARDACIEAAATRVRARPEWTSVAEEMREALIAPLSDRACGRLDRKPAALACASCRATLPQLETEVTATAAIERQVLEQLRKALSPDVRLERLRVADLVSGEVDSPQAVEELVATLRERLLALIEAGARVVVE